MTSPTKSKTLKCYHCRSTFDFYPAHSGFGDEIFFYCDRCGTVACVDIYSHECQQFYQQYIETRTYDAKNKSDLEAFDANSERMRVAIAGNLDRCSCGGSFKADATPRCPICRNQLEWDQIVDQIDQQSDSQTPQYFRKHVSKGWRDIYYFVLNNRIVRNNWTKSGELSHPPRE